MTPDQLQQKEKARVVAVVASAADSSAPSSSSTIDALPPSAPPLPRNNKGKSKRFSVFAAGAAPASATAGAKSASSAAADALRFYAQTLPLSLVFAAMMFGLYAATSYGLPHVLCKDSAKDEVKKEREKKMAPLCWREQAPR